MRRASPRNYIAKATCLLLVLIWLVPAQTQTASPADLHPSSPDLARTSGDRITRTNSFASPFRRALGFERTATPIPAATTDSFFLPVATYLTGAYLGVQMVVFDANADGVPDVVVAGCANYPSSGNCSTNTRVSVLLGKGDGSFQFPSYLNAGVSIPFPSVYTADVNADEKPDIIVLSRCGDVYCTSTSKITIFLGNGDGTFQTGTTVDTGSFQVVQLFVTDANQDKKPDLVLFSPCGTDQSCSTGQGTLSTLLGNGDGTFQPPVASATTTFPIAISVGDLNGDGYPDVVTSACVTDCFSRKGEIAVQLGKGNGQFRPPFLYSAGGVGASNVNIVDVNHDGHPDLVATNCGLEPTAGSCPATGSASVLIGRGNGTFLPPVTYSLGLGNPQVPVVADLNGDGNPDMVVASPNSPCCSASVLLGNSDGTFQPAFTFPVPGVNLQVSDLDGDGKLDLLIGTPQAQGSYGMVGIMIGNGDGSFQPPMLFNSGGSSLAAVAPADLNGDGKMDVVTLNEAYLLSGFDWGDIVGVLLNNLPPHSPTTTQLTPSIDPVALYAKVSYHVHLQSGYNGPVRGTITLTDGDVTVGTNPYTGHDLDFQFSYNHFGSHTLIATYSGDADSAGSASLPVVEYVEAKTSTVIAASSDPASVGQPVSFTAHVTSAFGSIPDGELVTFYDGASPLASVPLAGGAALLTIPFSSAGAQVIKAVYAGDHQFLSSSGRISELVEKYSTSVALSSSLNPSSSGQAVTFTAQVTSAGPNPTGKIVFRDGSVVLATVLLNSGSAQLTRSNLRSGTHAITAQYLGDPVSSTSVSQVVNQVVQ